MVTADVEVEQSLTPGEDASLLLPQSVVVGAVYCAYVGCDAMSPRVISLMSGVPPRASPGSLSRLMSGCALPSADKPAGCHRRRRTRPSTRFVHALPRQAWSSSAAGFV